MPRGGEAVSQELDFCAAVLDAERAARFVATFKQSGFDARICVPPVKR
jgi:hypothetical protein